MSHDPADPTDRFAKSEHETEVTTVSDHCKDSQAGGSAEAQEAKRRPWKTSFFRLAPLAGILCMLIAIASLLASLGILLGSKGAAVSTWAIPPSTYLAIFTAAANQAIRFAAFQGLAIAWWNRAMRGDTLAQLHRSWRAGMTVGGAVISGPGMGLIGFACLCSTLVSVDGPLLQKGTTIELEPIVAPPITLQVSMGQEIPHFVTGGWYTFTQSSALVRWSLSFNESIPTVNGSTPNYIALITELKGKGGVEWFAEKMIPGVVHGCPQGQTCKTRVRAPALAVGNCLSHSLDVNYWTPVKNPKNVYNITPVAPPLSTLGFIVDVDLVLDDAAERISVITGFSEHRNCTGAFHYKICTLDSAIGEYEVLVTDGGLNLLPGQPRIVALANNTKPSDEFNELNGDYPSTLAGIVSLAQAKWQSAANYYLWQQFPTLTGYGANVYRKYTSFGEGWAENLCWAYNDPQADLLQDLNWLMFMLGAEVGAGEHGSAAHIQSITDPDLPMKTTTEGYLHGMHNVYATDLRWFAAAALVELICIGLILPTYFGWWKLGRSVSLSPLEIAKAFEAPLLADCNSNSSGSDIAKAVGDFRVRYGEVKRDVGGQNEGSISSKLAFASPATVNNPRRLETFDV